MQSIVSVMPTVYFSHSDDQCMLVSFFQKNKRIISEVTVNSL